MKTNFKTRFLSLLLATLTLLSATTISIPVFAEDITTYVLDIGSLASVSQGSKNEGDTDTGGTDNFFTIHYAAKTYIDSNAKTFSDGYVSTKRLNLQAAATAGEDAKAVVSFTTQGSATVKVWWISGGNDRQMGILDSNGETVTQTAEESVKNSLYISTLTLDNEGTYYLGAVGDGGNNIYKIAVTTKTIDKGPRADWSTVENPVITNVTTNEEGKLTVTVNGYVDHNGADSLTINLYKDGNIVSTAKSTSLNTEHTLSFSPVASGNYTIEAILMREGEEDKKSEPASHDYLLPLEAPYITNVTNLGNGKALVIWNPVREAEKYEVVVNGGDAITVTDRQISLENLTVGDNTIQITAISGSRKTVAEERTITATEDAEYGWNFVVYGPSSKLSANYNSYKINEDGSVTISAKNNAGKLQPTGADGLGFYYTAVPSDMNFTFRATIQVDSWVFTNGQEGFGLMVTDHVPSLDYQSGDFWTNQYQALCTKIEYRYEVDEEGNYYINTNASGIGTKYTMKLGVGTISKIGIDQSIIDRTSLGETGLIVGQNGYLKTVIQSLERSAGFCNKDAGTYNVIGNWQGNTPEGTLDEEYLITELNLEIQKNNTGYFITYYDQNGNVISQIKNYDHDALEKFDSDYVYVGMFTSRYATATFKDVSLTLIDEEDDLPPEERPIEYITPTVTVTSTNAISSTNYDFVADTNVDGWLEVRVNNETVIKDVYVKKYERFTQTLDLSEYVKLGENNLFVKFTADADQELEPYTALASLQATPHEDILTFFKGSYHTKTIYVSPTGLYNGNGTKENPYDIYTAVNRVIPGQTIVLMEGTYVLKEGLRIQRGMNGTEEEPIRMIADPEASTRPVLDFVHEGTGITHGGNWWYFYGFDVTNTLDSYKGFQVSGNNNVLDNIHTYRNGNTGIQISRYHTADLYKEQWPANNLILNCTSWGNADKGYEDADGFAAKLTIGEGNVFDGCVAYNNADDGWDLFAKVATGSIGSVVIKNCVAYGNGYLEDGTIAGNGNGFKLGGDSLSGYHQLINCIAFNNKQKGIDSNSCPDIKVENCISYNNGSYNVALYTNSASNTDFVGKGIISFKDESVKLVHPTLDNPLVADNLKPKGNQDTTKYINSSSYYWMGETSVNDAGNQITADVFVSLEFTGITRNEDGTINMNGFLELNSNAPAGSGTTGDSTATTAPEIVPDLEHTIGDWTSDDAYVHWQECECGFRANVSEHTFEYVIDKEPTATEPGYKHNECTVCGYKKSKIEIPALGGDDANDPTDPEPLPPDDSNEEPIVDTTQPNIFKDFTGFWVWLWNEILKFFASLFGGNA